MEQRQRLYKARIALALYAKYGRVPKVGEITRAYNYFKPHHRGYLRDAACVSEYVL